MFKVGDIALVSNGDSHRKAKVPAYPTSIVKVSMQKRTFKYLDEPEIRGTVTYYS